MLGGECVESALVILRRRLQGCGVQVYIIGALDTVFLGPVGRSELSLAAGAYR